MSVNQIKSKVPTSSRNLSPKSDSKSNEKVKSGPSSSQGTKPDVEYRRNDRQAGFRIRAE